LPCPEDRRPRSGRAGQRVMPFFVCLDQLENSLRYHDIPVRGLCVDRIRRKRHPVLCFEHLHRSFSGQDLGHHRLTVRGQVLDGDKSHSGIDGEMLDEYFQSMQPTGRCPDAHHREIVIPGLRLWSGRGFLRPCLGLIHYGPWLLTAVAAHLFMGSAVLLKHVVLFGVPLFRHCPLPNFDHEGRKKCQATNVSSVS
jgi:hypothetical protein